MQAKPAWQLPAQHGSSSPPQFSQAPASHVPRGACIGPPQLSPAATHWSPTQHPPSLHTSPVQHGCSAPPQSGSGPGPGSPPPALVSPPLGLGPGPSPPLGCVASPPSPWFELPPGLPLVPPFVSLPAVAGEPAVPAVAPPPAPPP